MAPIIDNKGKNEKNNIYLLSGLLQTIISEFQQRLRIVCNSTNFKQNSGNITAGITGYRQQLYKYIIIGRLKIKFYE